MVATKELFSTISMLIFHTIHFNSHTALYCNETDLPAKSISVKPHKRDLIIADTTNTALLCPKKASVLFSVLLEVLQPCRGALENNNFEKQLGSHVQQGRSGGPYLVIINPRHNTVSNAKYKWCYSQHGKTLYYHQKKQFLGEKRLILRGRRNARCTIIRKNFFFLGEKRLILRGRSNAQCLGEGARRIIFRGRRSIWCAWAMTPVAPRIANHFSYVTRLGKHHLDYADQQVSLSKLTKSRRRCPKSVSLPEASGW